MPGFNQFRLLTLHYGFCQLAFAMAGAFVGAYLLKLGFSLPAALVACAGMLTARFGPRFVVLAVVRRLGYRSTMAVGVTLAAAQFPLLLRVETLVHGSGSRAEPG